MADEERIWIVMAAVDVAKNNGSLYETNATGLTEHEAEAEAQRRNIAEKRQDHVGINWFPAKDPIQAMKAAGFDVSKIRGQS